VQLARKEFKAFKAQKDQLEPQVLLDHKAAQVQLALQEITGQQVLLEQERRELLARLELHYLRKLTDLQDLAHGQNPQGQSKLSSNALQAVAVVVQD
jgi:hypothetical protein